MPEQFDAKTGSRGIEWCDETRNWLGGCMHDCKWEMPCAKCEGRGCQACKGTGKVIAGCYAKDTAESGVAKAAYPHGFKHHYFRPNGLKGLSKGKEPLLIFCDSMSDMFASNVPRDDVLLGLQEMTKAPHHAYQGLTKAPPQILKFTTELPYNLWVGVSSPPDWFMGNRMSQAQQRTMLRRSLEVLAQVKQETGNLVWLSAEPVSWDMAGEIVRDHPLDWVVIGAASRGKEYFQPNAKHIQNLLELFDSTNTPVFFKGNIKPLFHKHSFPTAELQRWREDFPWFYRVVDGGPHTSHKPLQISAVTSRQARCGEWGWERSRPYGLPQGLSVETLTKATTEGYLESEGTKSMSNLLF